MIISYYLGYFLITIACIVLACILSGSKSCWFIYIIGAVVGGIQVINQLMNTGGNSIVSSYMQDQTEQKLTAYIVILAIGAAVLLLIRYIRTRR